jgi:hypothetical protein
VFIFVCFSHWCGHTNLINMYYCGCLLIPLDRDDRQFAAEDTVLRP